MYQRSKITGYDGSLSNESEVTVIQLVAIMYLKVKDHRL